MTQDMESAGLYGERIGNAEDDEAAMSDTPDEITFGTLIRDARRARGWTQADLVARTPISLSTEIRWEGDDVTNPKPKHLRSVCEALGISPVQAVIALGYVTAEELGQPRSTNLPLDPQLAKLARVYSDPNILDEAKDLLRSGIGHAFDLWLGLYRLKAPTVVVADDHEGAPRAHTEGLPSH